MRELPLATVVTPSMLGTYVNRSQLIASRYQGLGNGDSLTTTDFPDQAPDPSNPIDPSSFNDPIDFPSFLGDPGSLYRNVEQIVGAVSKRNRHIAAQNGAEAQLAQILRNLQYLTSPTPADFQNAINGFLNTASGFHAYILQGIANGQFDPNRATRGDLDITRLARQLASDRQTEAQNRFGAFSGVTAAGTNPTTTIDPGTGQPRTTYGTPGGLTAGLSTLLPVILGGVALYFYSKRTNV